MFLNSLDASHVLVAHDDPAYTAHVARLLQARGCRVTEASGGAACRSAAAAGPALVLVSAALGEPGIGTADDGAFPAQALCAALTAQPSPPFVVVLLDHAGDAREQAVIDAALRCGAHDVWRLSLPDSLLCRRVEGLLHASATTRRADFLDEVLDSLDVAVVVTDDALAVSYVNGGATRMFRLPAVIPPRASILDLYTLQWPTPEARTDALRALRETLEWRGDIAVARKDGTMLYTYAQVKAVNHFAQTLVVAMLHDRTDRHAVEAALAESERVIRAQNTRIVGILQAIPQAVMLFNRAGELEIQNAAAETLFAEWAAQRRELGSAALLRRVGFGPFERVIARAIAGEHFRDEEVYFIGSDERSRLLSISTATHTAGTADAAGGSGMVAVVTDVTEHRRIALAEREQRLMAEALRDVTSTLTRTLDLRTVMMRILDNLGRVVEHDAANIMLLENGVLHIAFHRGYAPRLNPWLNSLRLPLTHYPFNQMTASGGAHIIDDTMLDLDWRMFDENTWQRAYLGVPIRSNDLIIGFLNIDSAVPKRFTPQVAEQLQAFADQAAVAIENAQLYEAIMRDAQELRALNRATSFMFTSDVFASSDRVSVGQAIVSTITREFLQVDCRLYVVSDETEDGLIELAHVSADSGQPAPYALTRAHVDGWMSSADVPEPPHPAIVSWLILPLTTGQGLVGAIELASSLPDAFAPQDVIILSAFGERVAATLENISLHRELHNRVEARTRELRQMKERAEAVLNHSSDPILVVRADHTIEQVNAACERVFGGQRLIGQPLAALVAPSFAGRLTKALARTFEHGETARVELEVHKADGAQVTVDGMISPIADGEGEIRTAVCGLHDITERKRIEDDLRTTLRMERAVSEMQRQFVARASHEFRTPLALIGTAANILNRYGDRLTDEQRMEKFAQIDTQVQGVTQVLDELLSLSRTHMPFQHHGGQQVDFALIVEDCVREIEATVGRSHRFELTVCTEGRMVGDAHLLQRAVRHLLYNAVKYSPAQTTVALRVLGDAAFVALHVTDQGMGIRPHDLAHLFEPFHRGENTEHIPGVGLGLAIVRQAAEVHHGTIQAQNNPDIGATFILTVPRKPLFSVTDAHAEEDAHAT
jgi:PAS domain S-box-containing protein